jgi:hypothetical protein
LLASHDTSSGPRRIHTCTRPEAHNKQPSRENSDGDGDSNADGDGECEVDVDAATHTVEALVASKNLFTDAGVHA